MLLISEGESEMGSVTHQPMGVTGYDESGRHEDLLVLGGHFPLYPPNRWLSYKLLPNYLGGIFGYFGALRGAPRVTDG